MVPQLNVHCTALRLVLAAAAPAHGSQGQQQQEQNQPLLHAACSLLVLPTAAAAELHAL